MKSPRRKENSLLIALLLWSIVAVGFFLPVSTGGWTVLLVKGVLFLSVLVSTYFFLFGRTEPSALQKEQRHAQTENSRETHQEEDLKDREWKGFGESFCWFYREFLTVVRTAVVASNAALYLRKGKEGFEFQAGEDDNGRKERRIFVPEGSLIDYIVKNKKPIRESSLPAKTTLTGMDEGEIQSFLGVPLIWEDEVVGVLALGSGAVDSFGEEDQELLIRCGTLMTQAMAMYHQGLQWEIDQEIYHVHLELEKDLVGIQSEENGILNFVQHLKKLFPFDRFTLCGREGEEGVIRYLYGQVDNLDRGLRFPLDEGINGWILRRNSPLLIDDMEKGNFIRPRYFQDEDHEHGLRSYLGVPLNRGENTWGCISLESRNVNQYGEKGKEVLIRLSYLFENALERLDLLDQIRSLKREDRSSASPGFEIE